MRNLTEWLILLGMAVILAIALLGCTAEQRMANLVRNHPELTRTDTIIHRDTFIVKGDHKDTIVSLQHLIHSHDTVIIHQNHLTEKAFYYHDSLILQGDCRGDTIVKIMKVPERTTVVHDRRREDWQLIGIIAMLSFVIGFLARTLLK